MAVPGYFPVYYFPGLVQEGGAPPAPFVPLLTVNDNGDGTATYAISGFDVPELVDVYRGKVSGFGPIVWVPLAANPVTSGDVVTEAAPNGLYFAIVRGRTSGMASDPVFFAVTDEAEAVATRNRHQLAATFALLPLTVTQRIYEQIIPDENNIEFPCTIMTEDGIQETSESGLSTSDDIGRPVKVLLCDRADRYDHGKLPDFEYWREKMVRAVLNQRTIGLPESVVNRVEYNVVIDPNLPVYQFIVSSFIVRSVTREPRGLGA